MKEGNLVEKFLIPPFSILDTKQKYWMYRRNEWKSLGIKSEVGRGDTVTTKGHGLAENTDRINATEDRYAKKRKKQKMANPSSEKNFGSNPDFANHRKAKYNDVSIFDPVLTETLYLWFTPNNGKILDPFAGGSVRGIVANYLGFDYTGIDLREEQVVSNQEQARDILPENEPNWIIGDSTKIDSLIPEEEKFDLVFTCPPYYDLEVYSELEEDLSTMDWEQFLEMYKVIIQKSLSKLKENRFAIYVISDVRDKEGFYRLLPEFTKWYFQEQGAKFYNEFVIANSVGSLPIRVGNSFKNNRKNGRMHQYALVFYKGDPKEIRNVLDIENIQYVKIGDQPGKIKKFW